MLCQLSIRNVAIVDQLELDLKSGLLAVSGETGAGKSIMLDSLALALGERADPGCVRHGSDKAEISACFDIRQIPAAQQWLNERELLEEEHCILRRSISAEGRSRAWINGRPCNLQELRELGELLVEIHGQHAHQRLLNPATHLQLLDDYGQLQSALLPLKQSYQHWQQLQKRLQQVQNRSAEDQAKVQLLSYQVEELVLLAPLPDELEQLEQEQSMLANAEQNLQLGQQLLELCRDDDQAISQQLRRAQQLLQQLRLDSQSCHEALEMLDSAAIQVDEAMHSLEQALGRCELDPARLEAVDQRLHALYSTARKHRVTPQQLPALLVQLQQELGELAVDESQLEQLTLQVQQARQHYLEQAQRLSSQRQQLAQQLSSAVMDQLHALSMPHCRFEVAVTALDEPHYSAQGIDRVELLLSANPGQPPRPLHKVASGGELSRISLAIQVVAAQCSTTPTLVFDEVDVGIGGAVAEVVGRLLRQLGERVQVLCVTHQPQVAAQAHEHLFVSKEVQGSHTLSRVRRLNKEDRIQEIARMLGGVELGNHARAHAEAMLQQLPH
ncbi:DNA repair protein RecN [Balneatrix alpica]|uniref:DNA repair protein RecN n=1 Tax=Balneatrix alpica TaxID=75684 RepID=UPI0027389B6E|nr:DNA repair protein RecN [Balneatrix alpica]